MEGRSRKFLVTLDSRIQTFNASLELMISKEKIICLSELKDTCVKLADQKCNNNYSVLREEYKDNYWFGDDDQYIVTFVCR